MHAADSDSPCFVTCPAVAKVCSSDLPVISEPYTIREARIHVRHIRDLLKSVDATDAYNGTDCNSLSFLNVVTGGDILGK